MTWGNLQNLEDGMGCSLLRSPANFISTVRSFPYMVLSCKILAGLAGLSSNPCTTILPLLHSKLHPNVTLLKGKSDMKSQWQA